MQNVHNHLNRLNQKLGSSPLILLFLGLLVLLLWICGTIVQIQTSEYLAQGGVKQVAGVAWSVLQQPWLMLSGQSPLQSATSWLYAWVVEAITLVFALALSVAVRKIADSNPVIAKYFAVCAFLLIALNSWADYNSSPGSSWLIQGLVAFAVGGIVVVGLPLGVGLIQHAIEEF